MTKIRLALTISGAVALGAYEGGVLAALLSALRPLCQGDDPTVRIDAIGGASAGSITGLLAARSLAEGMDPVYMMRQAWVERDSIQHMLQGLEDSPLDCDVLAEMANDLLDPGKVPPVDGFQAIPIRLTVMLACLRGFDYRIKSITSRTSVDATTYVDIAKVTVNHQQELASFLKPDGSSIVDIALASGANALGFPPKLLDRIGQAEDYVANGITNFPASGQLWYTDGGTLDNEPLGRTLDLVADLDHDLGDDSVRLHLLIHPHPTAAPTGNEWADPDNQPSWLSTLMRSEHLQRTQSLYDDLRRVEKTNTQIEWLQRFREIVSPALDKLDEEATDAITAALDDVMASFAADRASLPGHDHNRPRHAEGASADLGDLLSQAVAAIANVDNKRAVGVEVISPLVLPEAATVPVQDMLAGEILGHFGGFFDKHLRDSDFDLGYKCGLAWLNGGGLTRHGMDEATVHTAVAAAEDAYQVRDLWREWGKKKLDFIAGHHPFAVAGLMAQLTRVTMKDAVVRHKH